MGYSEMLIRSRPACPSLYGSESSAHRDSQQQSSVPVRPSLVFIVITDLGIDVQSGSFSFAMLQNLGRPNTLPSCGRHHVWRPTYRCHNRRSKVNRRSEPIRTRIVPSTFVRERQRGRCRQDMGHEESFKRSTGTSISPRLSCLKSTFG